MKKILLVLVTFSILSPAALAYNLEGIVYDYDGNPLVDAMVRLLNEQRFERGKDFTDRNGEYSIRGLPAGSYTLEIEKVGLKTVRQSVSLGGTYYESTKLHDVHLEDIVRFESVSESEMKGLYVLDEKAIPRGAFSAYRKGLKKLGKNDLDGALKHFKKAIKKHSSFSRCYTHVGEIYLRQKNYRSSEEALTKAIELNSQDPLPHTGLGRLYCAEEKWDQALSALQKAIDMDPSRAENHLLFGKAHYEKGNKKAAEKALVQGLLIQPRESGEARILLANLLIEQERWTDAKQMLKNYLRENPFADNKSEVKSRISEIDEQIKLFSLPPME